MTEPGSGPDSSGSLPDQRRPLPGEAAPGVVERGSFGVQGSGDTSGFGGLVRRTVRVASGRTGRASTRSPTRSWRPTRPSTTR